MGRFYNSGLMSAEVDKKKDSLQHYGVKGMEWGKHKFGKDREADRKYLQNATEQQEIEFYEDWDNKVYEDYVNSPDGKLRVYGKVYEPEFVQEAVRKYLNEEKVTDDEHDAVSAFISILHKTGALK